MPACKGKLGGTAEVDVYEVMLIIFGQIPKKSLLSSYGWDVAEKSCQMTEQEKKVGTI